VQARPATPADAAAIALIYNEGIEDRIATFETRPRTPRMWRDGSAAPIRSWSWRMKAGCSASPRTSSYRPRDCYAGIAEFSVYVARGSRGRGVGRVALEGLIVAARGAGLHKLVSRIFPENVASRALCRALGFREVGVYEKHGQLEGAWRDCVIVERRLQASPR